MRYPGENAAGQAPGRRRGQSGQDVPPRPGQDAGRGQPGGESSLFSPGYRDGRRGAEPAGDAARPGGGYGWAGGAASKGPVRGFPPAPGQPPPLYPPGQFSAWNRTGGQADDDRPEARGPGSSRQSGGHSSPGYAAPGYADTGYGQGRAAGPGSPAVSDGDDDGADFEPGYSALAVSDPAADVTSTQTWGAIGDSRETGTWTAASPSAGAGRPAPADSPATAGPAGRVSTGGHRQSAGGPPGGAGTRPAPGPAPGSAPPGNGRRPGTRPGSAGGRGTGARRTGSRKRIRLSTALMAGALALAVMLGAAYFLLGGHHGAAAPTAAARSATSPAARPSATPTPSPSVSPPPPGQWRYLTTRAADPSPLTLAQLFPGRFTAGASYVRTVRGNSRHCSAEVVGARLQGAVGKAGCSQVLRASYLSVSKKQMGTIGVLNLRTVGAAEKAGKSAGPAQFIAPLDAAKGPTHSLSKAAGLEEAEVKGHYLILVLADFTNKHAPKSKAQRRALESFMSQLIKATVNLSLTSRMVTGKP